MVSVTTGMKYSWWYELPLSGALAFVAFSEMDLGIQRVLVAGAVEVPPYDLKWVSHDQWTAVCSLQGTAAAMSPSFKKAVTSKVPLGYVERLEYYFILTDDYQVAEILTLREYLALTLMVWVSDEVRDDVDYGVRFMVTPAMEDWEDWLWRRNMAADVATPSSTYSELVSRDPELYCYLSFNLI